MSNEKSAITNWVREGEGGGKEEKTSSQAFEGSSQVFGCVFKNIHLILFTLKANCRATFFSHNHFFIDFTSY